VQKEFEQSETEQNVTGERVCLSEERQRIAAGHPHRITLFDGVVGNTV